jgi:hypothetical protein
MSRDDIISIMCKLKYFSDGFSTVMTTFLYEFSDRNYEVKFERDAGRIVSFHVIDKGEVIHEGN